MVALLVIGLLMTIAGLVFVDSTANGSFQRKLAQIASYAGALLLAISLISVLHANYFSAEKKACDKADGLWIDNYDICVEKSKLPIIEIAQGINNQH